MCKKVLSVLMVLCLLLLLSSTAYAVNAPVSASIDGSGITMSPAEFRSAFSDSKSTRAATAAAAARPATPISFTNVLLTAGEVSATVTLSTDTGLVTLPVAGALRSSYKVEFGINSAIVEAATSIRGYEVLLFEIYNDNTEDTQLLYATELASTPHLKLYIQDANGTLYLFESALPSAFASIEASQYASANKNKDLLWPVHLVNSTTKEVPTDSAILQKLGLNTQARAADTWTTWTNSTTYSHSFSFMGEDYYCFSLPYVEYLYTGASSGTWIASFKVAEHVSVSGRTLYGNNVFEYHNVKLSFGCGDNTTFLRTFQQGRVRKTSNSAIISAGKEITIDLLNKALTSLPYGTTFSTVLGYINTMSSASTDIILGSEYINLLTEHTIAVGQKLGNYKFEECTNHSGSTLNGDYYTFQAVTQYVNAGGNSSTVGALKIEFDVYHTSNYTTTSRTANIQLPYTTGN